MSTELINKIYGGKLMIDSKNNKNIHNVLSPVMGTVYRSPKPGAAPYVEKGKRVTSKNICCLIEIMKVFTSVQCGNDGVISEVHVNDGDMVEQGQILFTIEIS